MRQQRRKGTPDSCWSETLDGKRRLPGQVDILDERLGSAQLGVGENQQPGPAVGSSGSTQFGERPFQGLLEKAKQVLNGEAGNVETPNGFQVWCDRTGPPEPQGHGRFGGARQMLDFQADKGSRHNGLGLTCSALGMVLRNGMQPTPRLHACTLARLHAHTPVLSLGVYPCVSMHPCRRRFRPRGEIVTHELVAMPSWSSPRGGEGGSRIKAAARPQAHQ